MVGLRTQEGKKFELFFELVQREANKQGAVFFLDHGGGNEFENDTIEGEDLCGWLIPLREASYFLEKFMSHSDLNEWSQYICWAFWSGSKNNLKISFESF